MKFAEYRSCNSGIDERCIDDSIRLRRAFVVMTISCPFGKTRQTRYAVGSMNTRQPKTAPDKTVWRIVRLTMGHART